MLGKKEVTEKRKVRRASKTPPPPPPLPHPLFSSRSGSAIVLLVEKGAFIESNVNNYYFCIRKNRIYASRSLPKLKGVHSQG